MKPRRTPSILLVIGCASLIALLSINHSNAQGPQVQVNAADPASAEQGTVNLDVKVTGKGFKNGARARWFVSGTTDPGGVTVNSTTFISSSELSANITINDAATIANFDIQVLNSDGRGGKGTELFAVTAKGARASCGPDVTNLSVSVYKYTDATNTTTYNLWPDLTNVDGSPVPYVSGKSKGSSIDAKFQIDNCTYDFTMNLYFARRYMTYKFPEGSALGTSINFTGFNFDRVGNIPVTDGGSSFVNWCNTTGDNYAGCGVDGDGYFVRRAYGSAIALTSNTTYNLRFNYSPLDIQTGISASAGTAFVKVYHPAPNTWTLIPEQIPPPSGVTDPNPTAGEWSALLHDGALVSYHKMPFKIVLTKF